MTDSRYYDETAKLIADTSIYLIPAGVLGLIAAGFVIAGLWKIFEKAHEKGWKALIPFYNLFLAFKLCDLNPWLSLLITIPIALNPLFLALSYTNSWFSLLFLVHLISFWAWIKFSIAINHAFDQKTTGAILGVVLLPFIFIFRFGFNKKYDYQYLKGKNIPFSNTFQNPQPTPIDEPINPQPSSIDQPTNHQPAINNQPTDPQSATIDRSTNSQSSSLPPQN